MIPSFLSTLSGLVTIQHGTGHGIIPLDSKNFHHPQTPVESGTFQSPAGVIQGNGAKLDVPTADFWYVENGKIKEFNCYTSVSIMLEQMGIRPDFASAVGRQPGQA
jgi:hypothetical protein